MRIIAVTMDMVRWPLKSGWSDRQRKEQLVETYSSLRQQVPYLHSVVLVSVLGVALSIGQTDVEYIGPAFLLGIPLIYRLTFWLTSQPKTCPFEIEKELSRVTISSFIHSCGFALWALFIMNRYPDLSMTILVFCILASFGASFGMSALPVAAIMPLIFIGLPISGMLMMAQSLGHFVAAVSFMATVILVARILYQQHSMLSKLITSRMEVKRERNKARDAEAVAIEKAKTDELTKIANRARLIEAIEAETGPGHPQTEGLFLAIIDLDGFKIANDTFGHAAGDAVLIEIANRLRDSYGGTALVSRLGGDEFALLWGIKSQIPDVSLVADDLIRLIRKPIFWNNKKINIDACIGFASIESGILSTSEFLSQADSALYYAKNSGRGSWKQYDVKLFEKERRLKRIDELLQSGQASNEIEVEFQPIIQLSSGAVTCFEALARWSSKELGQIRPDEFIVMSESNGIVSRLGINILEKTIDSFKSISGDYCLSVNLSAHQASERGISKRVLEILDSKKFPSNRLKVEVTETALLRDLDVAKLEMGILREAGCWIALDDFGAGHASPRYLSDIPFDIVKFDGSLVRNIETSARARDLLIGLVQFCHSMGAVTVAEHVETRNQHDLIRTMGCDYAQGFYYGRPSRLPDCSLRSGRVSNSTISES